MNHRRAGQGARVAGWPRRAVARRRIAQEALKGAEAARTRLAMIDAVREAVTSVSRSPVRSILTSLGTALAIATAVATIGLADSTAGAVSSTFNALRATIVSFTDSQPSGSVVLGESSERTLERLNGVTQAGLLYQLNGTNTFPVWRTAAQGLAGADQLPVFAASPGALNVAGAVISDGRAYDAGMDARHAPVVLLGSAAAYQLGITSVSLSPVIFIGGMPVTVIGIVAAAPADGQLLSGILVPPGLAGSLAPRGDTRTIIVRTQPGAAQLIGRQGPVALDPLDPARITAAVPIDPVQLRNQVSGNLTTLLLAIAVVALSVGIVAITNTTLLAVLQRRQEIGLRRSLGAAPRHIAALVMGESALVGAIGAIIGTSIGVLVIAVVCVGKGWPAVIDPAIIAAAPPVGTLAGLLAGAYPAWRASRITPISALQR